MAENLVIDTEIVSSTTSGRACDENIVKIITLSFQLCICQAWLSRYGGGNMQLKINLVGFEYTLINFTSVFQ